jgi:hypothetical protein
MGMLTHDEVTALLAENWRQHPCIELEPADHPLAVEQQQGITLDRLLHPWAVTM